MAKYEFIDSYVADDSAATPITDRCRWLEVSTSGFYNWRSRPQSATSIRRDVLAEQIRVFFSASHGTYGYRRIHADLADAGVECSPELVRSIIREHDLIPCQPRPFRVTTDSDSNSDPVVPDLLLRDFTAVLLEENTAAVPRVLLSTEALQYALYTGYSRYGSEACQSEWNRTYIVDADGRAFVNYLDTALTAEQDDVRLAEDFLQEHKDTVVAALTTYTEPSRIREKYVWAAQYHNACCARHLQSESLHFTKPELTPPRGIVSSHVQATVRSGARSGGPGRRLAVDSSVHGSATEISTCAASVTPLLCLQTLNAPSDASTLTPRWLFNSGTGSQRGDLADRRIHVLHSPLSTLATTGNRIQSRLLKCWPTPRAT
ncbi:MAG: hypothetical protein ACJA07_003491 [Rhodococcus sp. (in: high G+C Gram-positive bacteria)]